MLNFTTKGYGSILVEKQDDIQKVKDEIKAMDEFEYGYLPEDMIQVMPQIGSIHMCYTHKFDALDLDMLAVRLWRKGVKILCINNIYDDMIYIHTEE